MKKILNKTAIGGLLAVALLVLTSSLVFALVITVDGNIGDWTPSGGGPNDARVAQDVDEPGIDNKWDVEDVFFTNDGSNMYMRWDTISDTAYLGTFQLICIDNDNNTTTGGEVSQCDGQVGTNMEGVDYVAYILGYFGAVDLRACGDSATEWQDCTTVSGATTDFAASGVTAELAVALDDIGFGNPLACPDGGAEPCDMRVGYYFDNGDTPPDDNVPNEGQFMVQVGQDSPTDVKVSALKADGTPSLFIAMGSFLSVGAVGVIVWSRRRRR